MDCVVDSHIVIIKEVGLVISNCCCHNLFLSPIDTATFRTNTTANVVEKSRNKYRALFNHDYHASYCVNMKLGGNVSVMMLMFSVNAMSRS